MHSHNDPVTSTSPEVSAAGAAARPGRYSDRASKQHRGRLARRHERKPVRPIHRATLNDVAAAAGVSRASVSKVLRDAYGVSPEMRRRVSQAIEELGYRPVVAARALRGASFTIGFEQPGFTNQFFAKLLAGARDALHDTRYQLVIAPADTELGDGRRAIRALLDLSVDGLVAVSPLIPCDRIDDLPRTTAMVVIGRHTHADAYDTVHGDDEAGTRLVLDHLTGLGHRAISHLTIPDQPEDTPHRIRLRAYEQYMRSAGLESHIDVVPTGPAEGQAAHAVEQLLVHKPWPSAIFAANDQLAIGASAVLGSQGIGPDVISLAGYDDIDVAQHPSISLTTVDQRGEEMGRTAVQMIFERIAGRQEPRVHVTTPGLVTRASTAPPRDR